jgi:hypothetical protein
MTPRERCYHLAGVLLRQLPTDDEPDDGKGVYVVMTVELAELNPF